MLSLYIILLVAFSLFPPFTPVIAKHGTVHASSQSKYNKAHSLGDGYKFDPRDGWISVNASNLAYKYPSSKPQHDSNILAKRSVAKDKKSMSIGETVKGVFKKVLAGLKGIGVPEAVTITWYTGHDLENPSCWTNTNWAPTDASFACALTQDGWTTRPECFKFLELCNSPKKCVFVRVVDSCAGCAKGSKHVDLTKAAFGQLANFNEGSLTVQLRLATEPDQWYENLWGPKAT